MIITSDDYVAYLNRAAAVIRDSKDYISGLDAATGDGDHWANLNLGFEAIILAGEKLRKLPIDEVFKQIGMLMMSRVGGSSGILYGGAYLAAAKAVAGGGGQGGKPVLCKRALSGALGHGGGYDEPRKSGAGI